MTVAAPPAPLRMDALAWVMLLSLSLVWGASFVLVEIILTALPVFTLVALRVLIAALALWAVVLLTRGNIPSDPAVWRAFVVLGVFNNAIPFSLIAWGITAIPAGLAAILNATTPLFTAVVAAAVLADERLTVRRAGGLVIGFLGVVVMVGPQALGGVARDLAGQLAILGAAVSYALAAVYGRRFARLKVRPVTVAAGQTTASASLLVPLALVLDGAGVLAAPDAAVWVAVLAFGLGATAFAYILYFSVLERAGATNVSLVTVLVPVSAVVIAYLALGQRIGLEAFLGMTLIALGLAVMDGRIRLRRADH